MTTCNEVAADRLTALMDACRVALLRVEDAPAGCGLLLARLAVEADAARAVIERLAADVRAAGRATP